MTSATLPFRFFIITKQASTELFDGTKKKCRTSMEKVHVQTLRNLDGWCDFLAYLVILSQLIVCTIGQKVHDRIFVIFSWYVET